MSNATLPYAAIMHEPGVEDLRQSLGLRVQGAFAKALWIEREAGQTTPEAAEQLDLAVQYEAEALARAA